MTCYFATKKGHENFHKELHHLKNVERRDAINAISKAREFGDLSENAEYQAAREKQSTVEGLITELETKYKNAEVINLSNTDKTKVNLAATVTIVDDKNNQYKYSIVNEYESEPKKGLISIKTPIARALLYKTEEDEVIVKTPKGEKIYLITKISYEEI